MRHNRRTRRLGRNFSKRQAMLENLVGSLLSHQQVVTTLQKAKEARRLAEQVITLGKKDSLHARRLVFSHLQNHKLTSKLFSEVAPRFKNRQGGYTRILQLQRRKGDGAQLALLELTEKEIKAPAPEKAKKAKPEKGKTRETRGHQAREEQPRAAAKAQEEKEIQKHPETKKPQPKGGFFKNLTRFFRNKGGG